MKKISPGMPEPYCYETDYRKIPREYLNSNIPQGRGIVKWAAFKTLPEQYERLEQYIKDQDKIDKPTLSDHQMSELNDTLMMKMFHDPQAEVSYFENGYIKKVDGFVHKVDTHNQVLQMYIDEGLFTLKLSEIVEIK
ncbi:YolD-like family protein [Staphylococcus gallinarum]|uniref:YolD-like family protein n=1 Tax=Staphylococcus gallinarum TaxID=1293 RepID=A0A3A0GTU5_STAGA|nr:YolD-like family protein [Staphylococcus gallinarum]MCQ9289307.1 YolD-like family protein [Staphylococcus gallinarum]PTE30695.1 hypothetical protein BUZ00_13220 [Staphylococcus gallinarum]PTK88670.1 hypothetical protein BUZ03_12950 [Staphylococcus gallinarum]RIL18424.1 YolD-like family protein [Staphylococcus gallinarum]RIL21042.1 YolD-like family protein [Staphylococcus gallinarum]